MYVKHGAVGPSLLDDGRLAMEVKTLHTSQLKSISAQTDVVIPGGHGDELLQVWRHEGEIVSEKKEKDLMVPNKEDGTLRLRSSLNKDKDTLPKELAGHWSIDVVTDDGQLVGRTAFTVFD